MYSNFRQHTGKTAELGLIHQSLRNAALATGADLEGRVTGPDAYCITPSQDVLKHKEVVVFQRNNQIR